MITRVKSVFLYVADQERSYDFYVNTLGFKVRTDTEMGPGARWLEMVPVEAEQRTVLTILPAKDYNRQPGEHPADFSLATDNAQQLYEDLKAKGIEVTEPVAEPWGTYLWLTDIDGHRIFVSEDR